MGVSSTSTSKSKNIKENDPTKCYYKTTFASLNIQGLLTSGRQKKETVLQFLRSEDIEVLALQETWLTNSHKFPESQLEGFRELRATRPSRKRGGASLYISNDITILKHGIATNDYCAAVMAK